MRFPVPARTENGIPMRDATPPAARHRWLASLAIGSIAGLLAFALQSRPDAAPDFIYPWTAARELLNGANPYRALPGGLATPFEAPLLYPIPAIIAAVPFSTLALPLAVGAFMGLSALLLAYAVTRDKWTPLLFFVSAPLLLAVTLGQWSPLLTAAALLPAGGFLAITKPNLGLALTIYRPTLTGLLGCAALFALSVLILPTWPRDWMHSLVLDHQSGTHLAPITTPLGFLLILGLLRWRRPEARLLLAMACVPQLLFFYDQLPLMLLPDSRRESYALILPSSAALLIWMAVGHQSPHGPKIAEWGVMLGMYFPCLVMVLRRPNEGVLPAWIERAAARFHTLLRRAPERMP